eukprot:CCRYP_013052-RA/>CCRYP_013052-RA protein AED:0.12 eAED:0.12 QI:156/1/0.87/1/0.42/0.37/8/4112/838
MSYQQDALRRLTCNRSAASLVASSSGSGRTAVSPAVSSEARRSNDTNIHRSNSATTSGRPVAAAVAASSANVEEEAQEETNEADRGEVRSSSAPSSFSHIIPSNQPPRHQYHQLTPHRHANQTLSSSSSSQYSNTQKPKSTPIDSPHKEGWTVVTPAPHSPSLAPCQRSLHAAAVVKDSLYVFGGYDGQNRVNDFYQYHFPSGCWREIITIGGGVIVSGVHQGTTAQGGNADMGGGANNNNNNNNNNNLNINAPNLAGGMGHPQRAYGGNITATGTVPTPRDRHAAVVHNSTFYIFGGFDGTSRVSDLYGFDVDRLVWREVRPRPPSHVGNVNAANIGNNNAGVVVQGAGVQGGGVRRVGFNNVDAGGGVGGNNNNNANNNIQWQHVQPQQQQLHRGGENVVEVEGHQQLPPPPLQQQAGARQHHSPPSPRHSHSAVVHNDSMYVFGGYDGSYRSDFHEFDFVQCSWRPVFGSGRSPRARYRATACVHEDMMILFGGHDGTRHLSDVHTFDFVTQVWSLLMTDGVPPLPRDSHVSVVYKNAMYVFGGSTGSAMNDLHELTFPSSSGDSITTDASAAPDYTTIAGSANFHGEDEDGEETIAIAKWRQIPPVGGGGIAVHRFCHVGAVYNGSFYVFGGYDGSSRLNDFVKYDLAMDDLFETVIPPSTILSDLRSFLDDEGTMSVSDITIVVEGIPVRAHKLMLMRCPYFRAMLLSEMAESSQSTVYIEIVRHSIFLSVLEYLYTDEVTIPLESAMELFVAADLFGIPRLQAMCERKLLESITVENAATIFHAADVHSASSLRSKALGYVLSHFEAVSKTSAFEDMARCNVELVFEILKNR